MGNRMRGLVWAVPAFLAVLVAAGAPAVAEDAKAKSPLDELPPYIKRVTHFGQRADWSHDGKRILFIEKTFGDVYGYKASNPVVRDDGRAIAFQVAKVGDPAGVGRGIFVLDLELYEKLKK